jgi:RNA polymerase sporulation-specific sigma factor
LIVRLLRTPQTRVALAAACVLAASSAAVLVSAGATSELILVSAALCTVLGVAQSTPTEHGGFVGLAGMARLLTDRRPRNNAGSTSDLARRDLEVIFRVPPSEPQPDLEFGTQAAGPLPEKASDELLIGLARRGDPVAYDRIVRRYYGFVRLKAASYLLVEGDADDLIQEGLVGLYKAVRDYRPLRGSSFRGFAESYITWQIVSVVKTASRHRSSAGQILVVPHHAVFNEDDEFALDEVIAASSDSPSARRLIATEDVRALVSVLSSQLSDFESRVLSAYLDGSSMSAIARDLRAEVSEVESALRRIGRKVEGDDRREAATA